MKTYYITLYSLSSENIETLVVADSLDLAKAQGVVQISFSQPPNPRLLMRYYDITPRALSSPIRRTSTIRDGEGRSADVG